jgi:hypothetical protein
VWNVRVLEVALLHPGKLITGACVYVLENLCGVDPRRPVAHSSRMMIGKTLLFIYDFD